MAPARACGRHDAGRSVFFLGLAATIASTRGESPALRGTGSGAQVLVFDAGSSGTRIHVFNLHPAQDSVREHVPRVDLTVRESQTLKVKPGLSSFARTGDLTSAQRSIEELLQFANQLVPKAMRKRTPVVLKATAGLRSVAQEHSKAILDRVRETLAASGYMFQNKWADIILGKEEGGLAWVAANYLRGSFEETDADQKPSIGIIEMGGGSTQVAFEVSSSKLTRDGPDTFQFRTSLGRTYHVYAHSYMGFGQDHAQTLLRDLQPASVVEDPCYPEGYQRKGPMGSGAVVKGSGDPEGCQEKIRRQVMPDEDAPGLYSKEIPLQGCFVATENFFYSQSARSLKLEERTPLTEADLREAGNQTCRASFRPTAEAVAEMQSGEADPGAPKFCFALAYQASVLEALKAFSLPDVAVQIARQISGSDLDWALGAAVVHYLEHGSPASQSQRNAKSRRTAPELTEDSSSYGFEEEVEQEGLLDFFTLGILVLVLVGICLFRFVRTESRKRLKEVKGISGKTGSSRE